VATNTTTPVITLSLGAITPTSVNGLTITAGTGILAVTGTASVSNTNTGDQTNITGNAATVTTNANLSGHVTSSGNTTSLGSFTLAQLNTAVSDADVASVNGSVTNFTGSLSGDVTGGQSTTAIAATTVTGKALTNYASTTGAIGAADTILSAIGKLNGNTALKISSDTSGGGTQITNLIQVTQSVYNGLSPSSSTLYVIVG
jgi:hypothetical protein